MARDVEKNASGKKSTRRKPTASTRPRTARGKDHSRAKTKAEVAAEDCTKAEQAAESHLRGILIRGEAAEDPEGTLPPGATHEIVERDEYGQPKKVVRRRFSMY